MLTVITGAPCSGKSTYLGQHARPDDIVIDFDAIAQHQAGRRAWVIDTSPTPNRRRQYEAAGARTVTCTADPAELHRRAEGNRPPDWHGRIDQWLASGGHDDPQPRPRTRW